MRGLQWVLIVVLLMGQVPAAAWRSAWHKPRCDVRVCKCRACAGGALCCCAQARSPLEQLMLQANCDRAEQEQLLLVAMPRLAPTSPLLVPAPTFSFALHHALVQTPLSRAVVPRSPPPRPSFKQLG